MYKRQGYKWSQVARQKEKTRYVVCNGDEGDPGDVYKRQEYSDLADASIAGRCKYRDVCSNAG